MSILTKRYAGFKRHFYRTGPIDFSKELKSYKTLLIHPVMEPGREIFSLPAIESIIAQKGERNVMLLINEKLKFFFKDIPSKKIFYKCFSSPLSSNYKKLKESLKGKEYDIFVELNSFNEDILTMFALIPKSRIRMCVNGSRENPIFNMIITTDKLHNEIERNNVVLKPLGIKRKKKRIDWQKHTATRKEKRKIGIAVYNNKTALRLFSLLKNRNFTPFLFVNERKKVEKMKKKIGDALLPIYPLEKVYEESVSCESIITSINPVFSIGFLQRKRMLLLIERDKNFLPFDGHHIEVLSLSEKSKSLFNKVNDFIEGK
ncbi:MAG: hypothetical protein E3J87_05195 [Candidatus Cloacimonadota bacterium]|nr:MAG: hypothetical protein E3J87_05195 [Candidatus Cloacimonadota bacterium]